MTKTIKTSDEYIKQYNNLISRAGKDLSYDDLIKLIIETRIARDMYRKEKNHFANRFRELRNQINKLKKELRRSIKQIDTRILNEVDR